MLRSAGLAAWGGARARGARPCGPSLPRHYCVRPGMHKSPITDQLWAEREKLLSCAREGPAAGEGVVLRKVPAESAVAMKYAFSTDHTLRDQYRNPFGGVRMGILLEDMDATAGNIAAKHCVGPGVTDPPLLVTASVDEISMLIPLRLEDDLTLAGQVAWVGRSSLQLRMEVLQHGKVAMASLFTFVARNRQTHKAMVVHQLDPQTDLEKRRFKEAQAIADTKKQNRLKAMQAQDHMEASTAQERAIARLLQESQPLLTMPALASPHDVLIRNTIASNSLICQPQQRNTAGRIFGGFLMRRAFELAYATAYLFAGSRPTFEKVEHVDFREPVEVGSLLRLHSAVILTQPELEFPLLTVDIEAVVARPEQRCSIQCNTFTFTFSLERDEMARTGNDRLKRVLASNLEEARRQLQVMQLLGVSPDKSA